MRDFKKIVAWQKAHALTLQVYKVSASFPKDELYGLTSQIRRASSSIAANIAEGCGRDSSAELARFVQIASGSASELEYHFLLAHDLGFIVITHTRSASHPTFKVKPVKWELPLLEKTPFNMVPKGDAMRRTVL